MEMNDFELRMNDFELKLRFGTAKVRLTERWADAGIIEPPTDKEVWGQMRAIACANMVDALADDMQGYVIIYQKRIQAIDEILSKL